MTEQIICAAIWYKDLVVKNHDVPLTHYLPNNIDTGLVFCGFRHTHCMYTMMQINGAKSTSHAGEEIQGFLTNHNRFVDRKEGAKIHQDNGGKLSYSRKTLYSEDLY